METDVSVLQMLPESEPDVGLFPPTSACCDWGSWTGC
jgi:hypothetical protein